MKKASLGVLLVLLVGFPSVLMSSPADAPKAKSNIQLKSAQFRVIDTKSGKYQQSTSIDYSKHNAYGWSIEFEAPKGKHVVQERFTLPAAANWGVGPQTVVSSDQKTATTTIDTYSKTTKFTAQNNWAYAPGDPVGVYTFEIFVDGHLVKTFLIDVTN